MSLRTCKNKECTNTFEAVTIGAKLRPDCLGKEFKLNVVQLDRVRNALARLFLNLIGLRNVTFISRSEPFVRDKH